MKSEFNSSCTCAAPLNGCAIRDDFGCASWCKMWCAEQRIAAAKRQAREEYDDRIDARFLRPTPPPNKTSS